MRFLPPTNPNWTDEERNNGHIIFWGRNFSRKKNILYISTKVVHEENRPNRKGKWERERKTNKAIKERAHSGRFHNGSHRGWNKGAE